MVVALTGRQWSALLDVTRTGEAFAAVESSTGHDFGTESGRYEGRDVIAGLLRPWFAARTLAEIRREFDGTGVSWGPYQTFSQLVGEDARCSTANPMFERVLHPGVGEYLMPRSPLHFSGTGRLPVRRAPQVGEHTEEVLAETLGLSDAQIGRLETRGVVGLGRALRERAAERNYNMYGQFVG
jgi:2-methylfumaryl-CoA isomerase